MTLDLLVVDCDDLKRDLIKAARSLSQYILNKMASELACEGQRLTIGDVHDEYSGVLFFQLMIFHL